MAWKKLLYLAQPYPDNYTDPCFLSQIKRNTTVAKYSYWHLVDHFSLIVLHLATIVLVELTFIGIYDRGWDPVVPVVIAAAGVLVGMVAWDRVTGQQTASFAQNSPKPKVDQWTTLRSALVVVLIVLVLSPVLKSLTRSTSSDSIWALSLILCLFNMLCHDYAMDPHSAPYRPILSTNLSLSNALVLASRLSSSLHVFCFVVFAAVINILVPLYDVGIRRRNPASPLHNIVLFVFCSAVFVATTYLFGPGLVLVWLVTMAGIALMLPAYFLWVQQYKNELQGPWDPAKPIIHRQD
ncbi:Phosphatidylinositol N-acetylglucosaminyltransferase subunit C [Meyerozyma sp. JA9]|nr:Phosphatidylinositol N-acetylglucosaminyltransferase subunit C [Meyerozyma sp. JA9]